MRNKTRSCVVCGTEYMYCNNCREFNHLPVWMSIYHDENCKNIMNIATEYAANNITKEDAKASMDKCDLTHRKNFSDSVARVVDEIYNSKKSNKSEKAEKDN